MGGKRGRREVCREPGRSKGVGETAEEVVAGAGEGLVADGGNVHCPRGVEEERSSRVSPLLCQPLYPLCVCVSTSRVSCLRMLYL